jgi:predicted GNAT family N-acyltransferase
MQLRIRVFCDEQGVEPEAELDGRDAEAIHLVAVDDGEVVATCRLRAEGAGGADGGVFKLERMAVDKRFRGVGLGRRLLEVGEAEAKHEGATEMLVHSQLRARRFYERSGYAATSEDTFLEDGIEHVRMTRAL